MFAPFGNQHTHAKVECREKGVPRGKGDTEYRLSKAMIWKAQ
jgi:hypothetical protein